VIESDGKTENAQHVLALDPFTLAALRAHVEQLDRRFNQLAAAAGLPEIDLHDVRHSCATAGRDARSDWKALSKRIGHADVAFTMKQYVQTDLKADRQVANTLAELIIGGSLASTAVRASLANPLADHMQKALSLFGKGPTALKFPGLWVLVSGFLRLVTVWLHVDRGGVTGSRGP
jgi:hypothetical protein